MRHNMSLKIIADNGPAPEYDVLVVGGDPQSASRKTSAIVRNRRVSS